MYLTDYHTHTSISFDSEADPLAEAAAARDAGISELCFTDHLDFPYMDLRPFNFDGGWAPRLEQYRAVKARSPIPVKLGLELGEAWEAPELCAQIVSEPELDLVIGSVHNLDLAHELADMYDIHYTSDRQCYEVLDVYFNCMERLSALDCWDVLGHVIYPLRYMNERDGNHALMEPYLPQLERIFKTTVATGRTIELNTNRGETLEQWRETLGLWRDCGGRFVTLGSDAHRAEDVGKGILQAAGLIREYGLDLAVYEKRQPRQIRL